MYIVNTAHGCHGYQILCRHGYCKAVSHNHSTRSPKILHTLRLYIVTTRHSWHAYCLLWSCISLPQHTIATDTTCSEAVSCYHKTRLACILLYCEVFTTVWGWMDTTLLWSCILLPQDTAAMATSYCEVLFRYHSTWLLFILITVYDLISTAHGCHGYNLLLSCISLTQNKAATDTSFCLALFIVGWPFQPSRCIKTSFYIPENRFSFPTTKGFRTKISMKLVYLYMAIFFNF